ncbi:MAG: cytochrome-c oxidase, cbb3-type subunit II, partial [Planctomycetaceae bacterium]|nr:cytochrome-c oxidase, cbb3-type subunit II [Planctomycetaceae bacterium]
FYGMSTFEGPLLSVKAVNSLSHYSDWTIAHVHSGALGWNGFMTFGMIYWLLPRIFQTELYSKKMAEWHVWLGTSGILLYIVPIYWAGITQGLMWLALNETGQLKYTDFVETTQTLIPFYWLRVLGGLLYISGAGLMAVNFAQTWARRAKVYDNPVYHAAPLSKNYVDPPIPESELTAVLNVGKKLDVWSKLTWHRRWERMPLYFTIWVFVSVVVASLFEIIPTFLIRSNVPTIATVEPYTPLELAGRDLYVSEGCYNCHSQMIRPIMGDTKRYGEYSKPGEFVYDHPFQWGSRRIGPDLAREGGKQSHLWHLTHFRNPSGFIKGSMMPSYQHLETKTLNFSSIPARVKAANILGAPYSEEVLNDSIEVARKQADKIAKEIVAQEGPEGLADKQVVAMIAYLQRLGTDLFKTPPAPAPVEGEAEAGQTAAAPDATPEEEHK